MIPIIIVSHKRASTMLTHRALNNFVVCVPENQKDEYHRYNPQFEIVTHPDTIIGSSPKRQWILEKYGECFMIDDDVRSFNRTYIPDAKKYSYTLTPDEAYWLIQDTANNARQAGAKLFGFNKTNYPAATHGNKPFMLTGFITGGAYGILENSEIFFPDMPYLTGDDYFLNGINAYFHRYCFIDMRFAVGFAETEKRVGGCADYRTDERRKETFIFLRKCFGDSIIGKRQSFCKKSMTKNEKRLIIPWL